MLASWGKIVGSESSSESSEECGVFYFYGIAPNKIKIFL
jgi:hypothetical protein